MVQFCTKMNNWQSNFTIAMQMFKLFLIKLKIHPDQEIRKLKTSWNTGNLFCFVWSSSEVSTDEDSRGP